MKHEEDFTIISFDLEDAGLVWQPSFGDEIVVRKEPVKVSVLVDTAGLTPEDLREIYTWRPSVEQMILQVEVRQAILKHTGLELSEKAIQYLTILETNYGSIESRAKSLRDSIGLSLRDFLLISSSPIH
jgi:hypothetical protein